MPASPRIATELLLSIGTTVAEAGAAFSPPPPFVTSAWSEVAISRAPAFLSATICVAAVSRSMRAITWRMRETLSA